MRYRLAVVAPSAIEVVRHIGGWLCDRTMAGWDVTAVITDTADARSLEILGVAVLELEASLATSAHDTWPHALAVAPELYDQDSRVRTGVLGCLDQGSAEVAMWGDAMPDELDDRLGTVCHRLSVAARAFKGCALAAAGLPTADIEYSEVFRSGELSVTGRWGGTDLLPVA
ncbi:hypothetical protein [Skermania piniformis]|uniref:Uncharacterized protein n=1 Tax=Skermania pinensis TaxID=39122 RepID=A0ABX8SEM5_9ACTN|nr:hypothetical protein [Skermania piniformis]QXQ15786.1 hypothetical protein KV203_08755 [Skermania piniformis]